MTVVARLTADLDLKSSRFEQGMNKANKTLNNSNKNFNSFFNNSNKGFKGVGDATNTLVGRFNLLRAGIAGVIGAAGLTALIKQQVGAASAIKDTADRLQIGTTALQKYQYAAKQTGLENETLETAIIRLNAGLADGTLKYKSTGDALNSIADAVKNAKTEAERGAIVNEVFGKKLGAKLIPLLKDGAAGLRAFGDEAQRTGNVIKDSTIQAAEQLGDNLDALAKTVANNFAQGFLENVIDQSSQVRDIYTDPNFAEGIKTVGDLVGLAAKGWIALASAIGFVVTNLNEFDKWKQKSADDLDEGFFDWASKKFDSPENQIKYMKKKRLEQNQAILEARIGRGEVSSKLGGGTGTPDIPTGNAPPFTGVGGSNKESADAVKAIFESLKNETDQLKLQTDLYGQKESAINRARKQAEIQNKLAAEGITLSKDQQAMLDKYLETLVTQQDLQKAQEKYNAELKDFTDAISSSFEDAIINGENLGDVFTSLMKDIERMLLKKALLEPLFGDGSSGSTGILTDAIGSIAGAIFGSPTASHATGQANVPYDMNVRVHKGERIIPAQMNKGMSRTPIIFKVTNNTDSKITTRDNGGNGEELEVMVDRAVAKNISRRGSQTNQSLGALSSRTLVRR